MRSVVAKSKPEKARRKPKAKRLGSQDLPIVPMAEMFPKLYSGFYRDGRLVGIVEHDDPRRQFSEFWNQQAGFYEALGARDGLTISAAMPFEMSAATKFSVWLVDPKTGEEERIPPCSGVCFEQATGWVREWQREPLHLVAEIRPDEVQPGELESFLNGFDAALAKLTDAVAATADAVRAAK